MNKILLLLLILSLFSCYQAPVSDEGGALSVIINTDVIKTAPVRGETELVLQLFNSGEFKVDQDFIFISREKVIY